MLNLVCQPVPMPPFSRGWKIQGRRMGGDSRSNARSLVSWKPWKLAIFVSLRHDSHSLDVPSTDGQRPSENQHQRNLAFRRFGCDQRNGYLAISLDRPNPALAMWLRGNSFATRRLQIDPNLFLSRFAKLPQSFGSFSSAVTSLSMRLTQEIGCLRFAPMLAAPKPRAKAGAGR